MRIMHQSCAAAATVGLAPPPILRPLAINREDGGVETWDTYLNSSM